MTLEATSTRRKLLARLASAAASLALGANVVHAQQRPSAANSTAGVDSSNLFAMDQGAAKPVRLPPKPGTRPSMSNDERDAVEHRIRCQCGCTLDVYTCRTTDFSCQVSPAMHRDVMALVEGGHGAQKIIEAFVSAYGERALMAPRRSGFNLVGWFAPGVVVATAAVALGIWLRRRSVGLAASGDRRDTATVVDGLEVTPEELARVEAAVRGDE